MVRFAVGKMHSPHTTQSKERRRSRRRNQHHGRPQILSNSSQLLALCSNDKQTWTRSTMNVVVYTRTRVGVEVDGWRRKGLKKTKLPWHVLRKPGKPFWVSIKKGFKVKLMLWIRRSRTQTKHSHIHPRQSFSAPTHKKYSFVGAAHINVYGEAICVQKNGWILWRAGSGGGENTSFTIYYWWPHEKRHLSPEKPLETSSLYTFVSNWNYRCEQQQRRYIEHRMKSIFSLWWNSFEREAQPKLRKHRERILSLLTFYPVFCSHNRRRKTTHNSLLYCVLRAQNEFLSGNIHEHIQRVINRQTFVHI